VFLVANIAPPPPPPPPPRGHPDVSAQSSGEMEELGLKSLPYLIISDYRTKSPCLSDDYQMAI